MRKMALKLSRWRWSTAVSQSLDIRGRERRKLFAGNHDVNYAGQSYLNNTSFVCSQVEISKIHLSLAIQSGGENNAAGFHLRQAQLLFTGGKIKRDQQA